MRSIIQKIKVKDSSVEILDTMFLGEYLPLEVELTFEDVKELLTINKSIEYTLLIRTLIIYQDLEPKIYNIQLLDVYGKKTE